MQGTFHLNCKDKIKKKLKKGSVIVLKNVSILLSLYMATGLMLFIGGSVHNQPTCVLLHCCRPMHREDLLTSQTNTNSIVNLQ